MRVGITGLMLLVVALGDVGGARSARAEGEPGFRFVYERAHGAEGCPDERRVRAELARLLGREPFGTDAQATLVCRVARRGAGLRAVITVVDPAGPGPERVLDSPVGDCRDLAPVIELTLALAIDPSADLDGGDGTQGAATPPRTELAEAPPAAPPKVRKVSEASDAEDPLAPRAAAVTTRIGFGVSLAVDVGLGPGPGVGAAAGVRLERGAWSLGVEAGGKQSSGADALGGHVEAQLWSLALVPCRTSDRLALCGVVRAGAMRGEGGGFLGARSDAAPWLGAGLRGAWQLDEPGGLDLALVAEALVPVVGGRLLVGGQEAWHSPPVGASLGLAVVFE